MAAKEENFSKLNFRIKVLADNNVVLVDYGNYESELFTPQIVNGRITLLNIIPNRRCCQITKTNVKSFEIKESREATNYLKEQNKVNLKSRELSGHPFYKMSEPLANSTPAGVKQGNRCETIIFGSKSYIRSANSSLATPEPVRRAANRPKILEKSVLNIRKDVMMSNIFQNPVEGTPKKFGRVVTSNANVSGVNNSVNMSILNGSYILPCLSSISIHNSCRSVVDSVLSARADSIARWEKVLTPVRTYTRKCKEPIMVRRPVSISSARKALKPFKFTPTYLVNPTQAPKVTQLIEIKKRKLLIDGKVCISPKTFKKQQKEPLETHSVRRPSTTAQTNSLSLHNPCRYLESMPISAFDLLTNSNRSSRMARNLNEQFRRGCVNKASSTYYRYKVLTRMPPLQRDELILELGH